MLERFFLKAEKNHHYISIILISFLITLILCGVNYLIDGNSLFLVALVSLAISYPVVNYMRSQTEKEFNDKLKNNSLIQRYEKELVLFWGIFLGITLGFYSLFPIISDYSVQETFVTEITGNMTNPDIGFEKILINNLIV